MLFHAWQQISFENIVFRMCIQNLGSGGLQISWGSSSRDTTVLVVLQLSAASSGLGRQFGGSLPGWRGLSCWSEEGRPVPCRKVTNGVASHPFIPPLCRNTWFELAVACWANAQKMKMTKPSGLLGLTRSCLEVHSLIDSEQPYDNMEPDTLRGVHLEENPEKFPSQLLITDFRAP